VAVLVSREFSCPVEVDRVSRFESDSLLRQGELTMRCIFTHQWTIYLKTGLAHGTRLAYRNCKRCGLMQRGVYDGLYQDIVWENVRERTFVKSQQMRIVRRTSSRFQQITHSLGLRRTRASDREGSGDASS